MSHEALSGHTCNLPSFLPSCGFVMIIVQSWRGMDPAGFEWTMTLAAGREHYLFVDTSRCLHVALGYPARACG